MRVSIMPKPQSTTNPFYAMLIVVGVFFVITTFAYFTMAVREADGTSAAAHGLTALLARHGLTILIAELVLLAVATCGAIGTDEYWTRRAAERDGFAREASADRNANVDEAASESSSVSLSDDSLGS
jgi:hypothetical protein